MNNDTQLLAHFSDPDAVARYAEGPPRFVPGFADLHRMSSLLLAERAPRHARLLVLGAGGGLELRAFADAQPQWTFDGVDPAAEMLKLAEQTLGPHAARTRLHQGYIDDAPKGPFDAAACLLTLHFLVPAERRRTLSEIHRRLKPGAPFWPRIRAFRNMRMSGRYGCHATPLSPSPPAPRPTRPKMRGLPSPPVSKYSTRKRTKRSCVTPASRKSACSMPPSPGAAGWPMPEG